MKFGRLLVAVAIVEQCMFVAAVAQKYKSTFVPISKGQPGLLFQPTTPGPKAAVGVFAMHDNGDYLSPSPSNPCVQLAERGYTVLCANATTSKDGFFSDDDTNKLMLNVKAGVVYLRGVPGVKKVVLFGHSGGGAMMAAYENIAENGLKACQDADKLIKCPNSLAGMPPADGVMLIDSTLGGPVSTLYSLDPAVIDENSGEKLDPQLDMYNPKNGFDPTGSKYSEEFKQRFFLAEGERMNRLTEKALQRLHAIEAGKGEFSDDEPFIVPGANGAQNKLNSQDISLQAHTKQPWPLLHPDGSITTEIIHSVRVPVGVQDETPSLDHGAITTTVREFLDHWAIRTLKDYHYDATSLYGVDHHSSYADEINSIEGIRKPLLQMGMTGSYEFSNAEMVREHAVSADKTLAYVDGAIHVFLPCKPCALAKGLPPDHYGDTVKTLFDYIDGWLAKPRRFLQAGSR